MIFSTNLTLDSMPVSYGATDGPQEVRLMDDAWPGTATRPYQPFVYNYTDNNITPVIRLTGDWFYIDGCSCGEFYAVLEDQNHVVVSCEILMVAGQTFQLHAKYLRIVAVKRTGGVRIIHGTGVIPQTGANNVLADYRRVTVTYDTPTLWETFVGPDGDPNFGAVSVSPVQVGLAGTVTSIIPMNPISINTTHYEFLFYGTAELAVNQDLVGTVSGGVYVKHFHPLIAAVVGGTSSTTTYAAQLNGVGSLAVYYRCTNAGATASAIPPARKLQFILQRPFIRQQGPFSVV